MQVGRPLMYKTPEEMQTAIDQYFKVTPEKERTITGLALYLGFAERKSLIDYANKDEFLHTIKKAKLMIEHEYEKDLRKNGNTGNIFALKNFGWKDEQTVTSQTSTPEIVVSNKEEEEVIKELLKKINEDN